MSAAGIANGGVPGRGQAENGLVARREDRRAQRGSGRLDAHTASLHLDRPAGAESFDEIVDAYQGSVYNLCVRMLWDPQEAEDAAQETFLRAYRSLPGYDPERRFGTWLLSIAAHYCIDRLRHRRPMPMGGEEWWETPDPGPGPEALYERRERQESIARILGTLGPLDRAALVLRYWYDLSYEELAHALSLPVNTVKSRIHRAKRRLAEEWMRITVPASLPQLRTRVA